MSQIPPKPDENKKKRHGRSPAFPFIPLGKALDRAETFRVAEGGRPKHFTPLVAACKAWGIGAQTGTAIQTIAALGHFGLFEFEGSGDTRSARLTDLAFKILHDKQPVSEERDYAIQQAALLPKIHSELWEKWQAELPSDPTIETFLVRDRGFSEKGAGDLIAEYKATLEFAKLGQPSPIPQKEAQTLEPDVMTSVFTDFLSNRRASPKPPPPEPTKKVQIMEGERELTTGLLSKDAKFRLIVSGPIGVKEIERLIAKLELDKEILAEPEGEPTHPADSYIGNPNFGKF